MSIQNATPYLMLCGRAEQALSFYERAFGAKTATLQRFGDVDRSCPEATKNRVMHAELRVGNALLMMSDGPTDHAVPEGSSVSIALKIDDSEEGRRSFDVLASSGTTIQPLIDAPWGALFGVVRDSFGVVWMFNCAKHAQVSSTEVTASSARITTPSDRTIRIERTFNAPRDRVWKAFTTPELVAQWWGRGNRLVIERMVFERGGHWRFVEHAPSGAHGFEGRYREVTPPERTVQTFEWDGMPGHVAVETMTLEDLGNGRTRLVAESQFHTTEERDGMLHSGMEGGVNESYSALDRLLATLG